MSPRTEGVLLKHVTALYLATRLDRARDAPRGPAASLGATPEPFKSPREWGAGASVSGQASAGRSSAGGYSRGRQAPPPTPRDAAPPPPASETGLLNYFKSLPVTSDIVRHTLRARVRGELDDEPMPFAEAARAFTPSPAASPRFFAPHNTPLEGIATPRGLTAFWPAPSPPPAFNAPSATPLARTVGGGRPGESPRPAIDAEIDQWRPENLTRVALAAPKISPRPRPPAAAPPRPLVREPSFGDRAALEALQQAAQPQPPPPAAPLYYPPSALADDEHAHRNYRISREVTDLESLEGSRRLSGHDDATRGGASPRPGPVVAPPPPASHGMVLDPARVDAELAAWRASQEGDAAGRSPRSSFTFFHEPPKPVFRGSSFKLFRPTADAADSLRLGEGAWAPEVMRSSPPKPQPVRRSPRTSRESSAGAPPLAPEPPRPRAPVWRSPSIRQMSEGQSAEDGSRSGSQTPTEGRESSDSVSPIAPVAREPLGEAQAARIAQSLTGGDAGALGSGFLRPSMDGLPPLASISEDRPLPKRAARGQGAAGRSTVREPPSPVRRARGEGGAAAADVPVVASPSKGRRMARLPDPSAGSPIKGRTSASRGVDAPSVKKSPKKKKKASPRVSPLREASPPAGSPKALMVRAEDVGPWEQSGAEAEHAPMTNGHAPGPASPPPPPLAPMDSEPSLENVATDGVTLAAGVTAATLAADSVPPETAPAPSPSPAAAPAAAAQAPAPSSPPAFDRAKALDELLDLMVSKGIERTPALQEELGGLSPRSLLIFAEAVEELGAPV